MPNAAFFPERSPRIAELEDYIDNWNEESHHFGTETGAEPREDGSPITDHVRERNPNVTLIGTTSSFGPNGIQKAANLVQALRRLERMSELVTVVTEWGVYEEILVVSARARRWGRGAPNLSLIHI